MSSFRYAFLHKAFDFRENKRNEPYERLEYATRYNKPTQRM